MDRVLHQPGISEPGPLSLYALGEDFIWCANMEIGEVANDVVHRGRRAI